MMSLTFGLFTQVSGSGPLGPLVFHYIQLPKAKGSGVAYSVDYGPAICCPSIFSNDVSLVPFGTKLLYKTALL